MNLNDMTLKQLAEVYNKHAAKPIKAFTGKKEDAIARVKAVLRRADGAKTPSTVVSLGDLRVDAARREALVNGQPITLRAKEFDLLAYLVQNPGLVLSREQLLNAVWGYDFYGDTRTVDVHVAHLRDKLEPSAVAIETVWGVGYKLVAPSAS